MTRPGWITTLAIGVGATVAWVALQQVDLWRLAAPSRGCLTETACVGDAAAARGHDDDDVRVEIPTDGLPHKGASADSARVIMLECSDYDCPYSRRASGTVDDLLAHNDDLAFYHLLSPLRLTKHGVLQARAAAAAARQGKFWEMHAALYESRVESRESAIRLAAKLGLDADRFARDLRDPAIHDEVDRQRSLCRQAGVQAVPTFFINGKRVTGARPAGAYQKVIDRERGR